MSRSKRLGLVAGMLSVALAVTACSSGSDDSGNGPDADALGTGTPQSGGSLTVRQIQDVTSLDPVVGNSGYDQQTLYPFYDRLINLEPQDMTPLPGLAKSWSYPDPNTLVLDLQTGVKFQDGTPFNADAVVANLDRARTLQTSTVIQDLSTVAKVEAVTDSQVKISLSAPNTSLLIILADRAGMMASPTAIQGGKLGEHPVGTGPFVFSKWLPGNELVGTKNPDYWQEGKPYLDTLTFKFITPPDTARNALSSGQVDMSLNIPPADVSTLKADANLTVSVNPSLFVNQCYLNFSKPPFDNQDVRTAVNLAIDRKAVTEALTFGNGQPAEQMFPEGYWAYDADLNDTFPYDPDKAKELLEEAGYGNGLTVSGVTTTDPTFARLNELIQGYLSKVGITMDFEQQPPATATTNFFTNLGPNIYCSAWSGRPDATQTVTSLYGANSFFNAGKYAAPGMAEAITASSAGEIDERAEAIGKVTELAQEYALNVPVSFTPNVDAYVKKVGGFTPTLGKADVSFLWINP